MALRYVTDRNLKSERSERHSIVVGILSTKMEKYFFIKVGSKRACESLGGKLSPKLIVVNITRHVVDAVIALRVKGKLGVTGRDWAFWHHTHRPKHSNMIPLFCTGIL